MKFNSTFSVEKQHVINHYWKGSKSKDKNENTEEREQQVDFI